MLCFSSSEETPNFLMSLVYIYKNECRWISHFGPDPSTSDLWKVRRMVKTARVDAENEAWLASPLGGPSTMALPTRYLASKVLAEASPSLVLGSATKEADL